MKINIWIPRENVLELNAWLKTPWDSTNSRIITFFHDKHDKRMDLIQVCIDPAEYQKIVDSNEEIQSSIAEQLGWVTTSTAVINDESQIQMLFGD
tara:strand:+ start:1109 stop:1393 length:285 start_codon:yes stop_codon:yes gene_type:complete